MRFVAPGILLLLLLGCGSEAPVETERTEAAASSSTVPDLEIEPAEKTPRRTAGEPSVMLIGWDGADWSLLDPMIAAGELPNLARLVRSGRTATLEVEEPLLSPIIWTSLATGVEPPDHGVLSFEEIDPDGGGRVPVSLRSRRFPAVWSTASRYGRRVGVIGWWASWPAEAVDGFVVSDRFLPTVLERPPVGEGLVHPERLLDRLERLRSEEVGSASAQLQETLGVSRVAASRLGREGESVANGLERILVQSRIVERLALELGGRFDPDLLAVYVQGTDEVGHVAALYHPPRLDCVAAESFALFSGVVKAYYRDADRFLGRLLDLADRRGDTVVLVSDHGFRWGDDRPCLEGAAAGTAAYWHTPNGVLVVGGRGVAPVGSRSTVSVYELVPTLSRLLGLPTDERMPGQPLIDWFNDGFLADEMEPVDLVDQVPVEVAVATIDERSAADARDRLRALGYLGGDSEATSSTRAVDVEPTWTDESWNNLGLFLRGRGRLEEAERAFETALELDPDDPSAWHNLSFSLLGQRRYDESDEALVRSLEVGNRRVTALVGSRLVEYRDEPERLVAFFARAIPRAPVVRKIALGEGRALYESGDCRAAGRLFEGLIAAGAGGTDAFNLAAVCHLCLRDPAAAVDRFRRSLALDPDQQMPREALARLGASG